MIVIVLSLVGVVGIVVIMIMIMIMRMVLPAVVAGMMVITHKGSHFLLRLIVHDIDWIDSAVREHSTHGLAQAFDHLLLGGAISARICNSMPGASSHRYHATACSPCSACSACSRWPDCTFSDCSGDSSDAGILGARDRGDCPS